jgi:type IV secretion system protein VirB5
MSDAHLMLPPAKDFNSAKRQFVELYGSTAVMNTYLKIALSCLCGVCLALVVLNLKTHRLLRDFKPIVIRINEVGRAEAVNYGSLEYHPQEAEIKYFLSQFVRDHYGRMRATVKEDYARSLYFLEAPLADGVIESSKSSKDIESLLAGQGEENDVKITNVSIEDLRTSPYHATVDFEKVYYGADRQESRREKYTANFLFIVKARVPNNFIPINPLGLTIIYFREDQSFSR